MLDYDVASSYYTTRIYEERGVKVRNRCVIGSALMIVSKITEDGKGGR